MTPTEPTPRVELGLDELEREGQRVGQPWSHRVETYETTLFKGTRRMHQVRDELDEPLFATRPDAGSMPEDEWQRLADATRLAVLLRNAAPELLRRARKLAAVEAFLREHGEALGDAMAHQSWRHSHRGGTKETDPAVPVRVAFNEIFSSLGLDKETR